jgi:formiminotetrahydrofolate cyclodeaminase
MSGSYLEFDLGTFLRATAEKQPAPGGGTVAAITVAAAAALAAMVARFSETLPESAELSLAADRLRERAAQLSDADAQAYGAVIEAYAQRRKGDPERGEATVRAALTRATEIPLQIAETGSDVAALAVRLLELGNRNLTGDAYTAACLADAAVRSAALLVQINARTGRLGDALVSRAEQYLTRTTEVVRHADAFSGGPREDEKSAMSQGG